MNRRKTTPLIISIVAAVLGALLLMTYAKSNSKSAPKERTVALVRAKARIPKDTPLAALTADNNVFVEEVQIPESAAVPGALTIQALKTINPPDQLALSDISPGETILPARFAPRTEVEKDKVPDAQGKLQITVALNSERVLNGFDLRPGDKVAIIATLAGKQFDPKALAVPTTTIAGEAPPAFEQSTKIILRKVTLIRLIAPAGVAPSTVPGSVAVDPSIVEGHWYAKLAVTPEEAQKVVYAMQVGGGTVWLALDPDSVPTDDTPYWNPGATNGDNIFTPVITAPANPIVGGPSTTKAASAPAPAAPAAPTSTVAGAKPVPGAPTRPGQPAAAGTPTTIK